MDDEQFPMPDAMNVETPEAGFVQVQFFYDGSDPINVFLDQPRFQFLLAALHEKIDNKTVTPISPSGLAQSRMIQVHGTRFRHGKNGDFDLTLFATVDGRDVSVPFSIDKTAAREWVQTIQSML